MLEDWAYPTSARLNRPRIILEYLDFSGVSAIKGLLVYEGYYLVYKTGEFLLYE